MQIKRGYLPESVFLDFVIPILIIAGIAIVLFVKATTMAFPQNDTSRTFYSMTAGLENYYEFKIAWRPRLFSTGLAAWTVIISTELFHEKSILSAQTPLELAVGVWTVGWFIFISFILLCAFKRRSVFYIFGIFSGISFGYMDIARANYALRLYPWDLPALFFFTLFVLLFIQKKYLWLLVMIPVGTGFKESVMILCLAFLFAELPWKQRLYLFFGAGMLSLGMKIILDIFVHVPLFFTMETGAEQPFREYNLTSLKNIVPLFINSGTLLAFFILPSSGNKNIIALRLISIPFIAGNLLFGIITEYRIWLELIPFALYTLDVGIYGSPLPQQIKQLESD